VSERRCEITYAIIHHSSGCTQWTKSQGMGKPQGTTAGGISTTTGQRSWWDPHKGMGRSARILQTRGFVKAEDSGAATGAMDDERHLQERPQKRTRSSRLSAKREGGEKRTYLSVM